MGASVVRRIVTATLVAGTLDILAAIVLTLIYGGKIPNMLRYVASGPFPDAKTMGAPGAVLGLGVHYALMAIMASVFVLAADRFGQIKAQPLLWGVIYGLVTFAAMNLAVVPLRFGTTPSATAIATQLFCHIVLVGIPIAFIARR